MPNSQGVGSFEENLHRQRHSVKNGLSHVPAQKGSPAEDIGDLPGWNEFVQRTRTALDAEAERQQQQIDAAYSIWINDHHEREYKGALEVFRNEGKTRVDKIIDEAYHTAIQMGLANPQYQIQIDSGMVFLSSHLAQTISALRIPQSRTVELA